MHKAQASPRQGGFLRNFRRKAPLEQEELLSASKGSIMGTSDNPLGYQRFQGGFPENRAFLSSIPETDVLSSPDIEIQIYNPQKPFNLGNGHWKHRENSGNRGMTSIHDKITGSIAQPRRGVIRSSSRQLL